MTCGGRAVGVSDVQIWDVYPVQGVGVAGTDDVLHVVPGRLRCEADGAHEAAFARAGAALYDSQKSPSPAQKPSYREWKPCSELEPRNQTVCLLPCCLPHFHRFFAMQRHGGNSKRRIPAVSGQPGMMSEALLTESGPRAKFHTKLCAFATD